MTASDASSSSPTATADSLIATPDRAAFGAIYSSGQAQILSTKLVADLETPVSAYLKLSGGSGGMSFLLESVEGGAQRGRYSIIGARPDVIWRAQGHQAEINRSPDKDPDAFDPVAAPTLDALRELLAESAIPQRDDLPPMAAGVFGYMGYDTVRLIEHLPDVPPDDLNVPDAIMMRPTLMVIFDAVRDEMTLTTPVRPAAGVDAQTAYDAALGRLADAVDALQSPLPHGTLGGDMADGQIHAPDATSNTSEDRYLDMVAQAKEYIAAGDIFQVVLAQRFTTDFT
ncbi:MAG: anthranilate synthase component I, partial [Pseudomonadota bacterium]